MKVYYKNNKRARGKPKNSTAGNVKRKPDTGVQYTTDACNFCTGPPRFPLLQYSTIPSNVNRFFRKRTWTNERTRWGRSYPQPAKLSTVYPQSYLQTGSCPFSSAQCLSQSPSICGILAPYPTPNGGSHGALPFSFDNPLMNVSMMPSWLPVDIDEQPWSHIDVDIMINDALKPLDSLDTICLDLSLYCIYIITYIEDLSTTLYTV